MRSLDPTDAVVTGLGWATPLGMGEAACWLALRAGQRGTRRVEVPAGVDAALGVLAPIERPWLRAPVPAEQESQAKFLNTSGELAATVVHEALQAAEALADGGRAAQRGLFIAQNDYSRTACHDFRGAVVDATQGLSAPLDGELLNKASLHKVNPFVLLETLNNNAFSFITASFGLKGSNATLSGWEGTGLAAFGIAARAVRTRRVALAVACGAGSLTSPVMRHELARLGVLSRGSTADAPRPFDAQRDGTVPADAAAAAVLEPLEAAGRRVAGPCVAIAGVGGATGEPMAGGLCAQPATLVSAARAALRDAGVRVDGLGAIVAPGSGRRVEDAAVLEALSTLLEGARIPVVSACGALGHAASGTEASHVALAVLALREGSVPPTPGFRAADAAHARVAITTTPTPLAAPTVLVLSSGWDGQAHALVLARVR